MRKKKEYRKLIIYFLLVILIAAGSKGGFDAAQQIAFSYNHIKTETLESREFTQSADCWIEETGNKKSFIFKAESRGDNCEDLSIKYNLYFCLFALAVIPALAGLDRRTVLTRDSSYVYKERYMIAFIQDQDGRKRSLIF